MIVVVPWNVVRRIKFITLSNQVHWEWKQAVEREEFILLPRNRQKREKKFTRYTTTHPLALSFLFHESLASRPHKQ